MLTEQDKTADKALNDLMTAEHSLVNAQCVLAEHINDLQERIEKLEAHIREARSQLAWCNSQYGPDASTNTVLVALDRALNSIGGRRCLTGGPYEHEAV